MRAKARKPRSPYKSQLEADFAQHLEVWRRAGEIRDWKYERVRLSVGNGAWYKPDFKVIEKDGGETFYETKGWWREAGRVRIKAAAQAFPEYLFVGVQRESGKFICEEF